MYKVNDTIIYGTQGVCKIIEIAVKDFMGQQKEYYVMQPINNSSTTLFAPTDNKAVLAKIRRILSANEIEQLVSSIEGEEMDWIPNDNQRRENFKRILDSDDHKAKLLMIKAIWLHKQKREAEGKKLHMADEHIFRDAENLLYNEFQYVLNINKDELIDYIFNSK